MTYENDNHLLSTRLPQGNFDIVEQARGRGGEMIAEALRLNS